MFKLAEARITSKNWEDGLCFCDIQTERSGVEETDVQIINPLSGFTVVPEEGDIVIYAKLKESKMMIFGVINKAPFKQRELGGDEIAIELDKNTELSMVKNSDDDYDVIVQTEGTTIEVTKNNSGNYDVDVDITGRCSLEAGNGFELLDDDGYGIVDEGNGNYKWYHENIDFDSTNTA